MEPPGGEAFWSIPGEKHFGASRGGKHFGASRGEAFSASGPGAGGKHKILPRPDFPRSRDRPDSRLSGVHGKLLTLVSLLDMSNDKTNVICLRLRRHWCVRACPCGYRILSLIRVRVVPLCLIYLNIDLPQRIRSMYHYLLQVRSSNTCTGYLGLKL